MSKDGYGSYRKGRAWMRGKLKSAKGSFNWKDAYRPFLKSQGLEGVIELGWYPGVNKERLEKAKALKVEFERGVEDEWNDHYRRQHPSDGCTLNGVQDSSTEV